MHDGNNEFQASEELYNPLMKELQTSEKQYLMSNDHVSSGD